MGALLIGGCVLGFARRFLPISPRSFLQHHDPRYIEKLRAAPQKPPPYSDVILPASYHSASYTKELITPQILDNESASASSPFI